MGGHIALVAMMLKASWREEAHGLKSHIFDCREFNSIIVVGIEQSFRIAK
jgi:hypothetical protein